MDYDVRMDNTARRGTQNAPQFRQWNWNNREGEEKVLAVGPPQCSVAMAVVQCKTSDSEMRDSFFSFSLSLSLRKGRHSAAGNQNLHLRPPFPRVSSVPLSVECKNIHAERARAKCLDIAKRGTKDTFSSYAK